MVELLAQVVAPPLQNSPVRLPTPAPLRERPATGTPPPSAPVEIEPPGESPPTPLPPGTTPPAPGTGARGAMPAIRGLERYPKQHLERTLATCLAIADPRARLEACAAALTARLIADGYVNSRVYAETTPPPGRLVVVDGILAEVLVRGEDPWLVRRVQRLLRPLQGQVLHLPTLEAQLQSLKRQRGVGTVRGSLARLGSDPTRASFTVSIGSEAQPWQGELAIRNDGSNETGDARAVGTLLKPDLALRGDAFFLYGEVNGTTDPQFGSVISSISYTLPLADGVNLTGAFGYSRRNLIELPPPADEFSINQLQGLGQIEWVFRESLNQRWSAYAGVSANRSTTFLSGRRLNTDFVPESSVEPRSGYLQVGFSGAGQSNRLGWGGNVYLLQGIGAFTPERQRQELATVGIVPGKATALGGLLSASWGFAPRWQLNLRAAGQVALQPLLSPMQFTLGSDVGLRGLPGQLVSGDNGWLGTGELVWSFWQRGSYALQLVPFIGAGGVNTDLEGVSFRDTVGSGGVLVRWLAGTTWTVELGWVDQFDTQDNLGAWNDWVLADGLYAKVQYRF